MYFRPEIGEDLTMEFAAVAREMNSKNIDIISLGLGEPSFSTPKHIIEATYEAMNEDKFRRYSNPIGLFELRQAIVNREKIKNNIITCADNVIVTSGAKQALFLSLLAMLEPGDEVINFSPSYVCYIPDVYIAEPKAVLKNIALNDDFTVDFEALESVITKKTKVILLNTPHNPTGQMLSREESIHMAELAKKNNIYIISDEIYDIFNFSNKKHYSIAGISGMEDLAVTINGFSKAYSMTGWRIGYAIAPKDVINRMRKLQLHTNTNTCTFIQKGAAAALEGDHSHIGKYNMELNKKANILNEYFNENILKNIPDGGFFAFLDISGTDLNSNAFSARLIKEKHVATSPGISFGKEWDSYIRISLLEDYDRFKVGIERLNEFILTNSK
jgi:aspartate aminotransferase